MNLGRALLSQLCSLLGKTWSVEPSVSGDLHLTDDTGPSRGAMRGLEMSFECKQ